MKNLLKNFTILYVKVPNETIENISGIGYKLHTISEE